MVARTGGKGDAEIGSEAIGDGRAQTAGLILLFREWGRPDRAAIRAALARVPNASISFDPGAERSGGHSLSAEGANKDLANDVDSWLELLVDGLTFDLFGLAPGPQISVPPAEFRFDCPPDFDLADYEAVGLAPGPHLAGGRQSLAVARSMTWLACRIAEELGNVEAFYWLPSLSVTGSAFFMSTVDAWIDGGPFPALGMSAFRSTSTNSLISVGLAFFTGQEVEVPQELAGDRASATQLAMRLVHQLALHGRLEESEVIMGPDGRNLELAPDPESDIVRVRSV